MKATRIRTITLLGAVLASPLAMQADDGADLASLRAQLAQQQQVIQQQQQRLASLEGSQEQNWLNERRAQEVKSLVREVLADADTRASLLESSLNAGYKNGFFLASEDGTFNLKIGVESQIRYIYNSRDNEASGTDEDENGFQIRRGRVDFRGNAFDPKLTYRLRLAATRDTGNAVLEVAQVGYEFADGCKINAGQFKPLFLREENVSGFRQLAVERTYAADYFTIDYSQAAELTLDTDWLRGSVAVHDGSYTQNSDFDTDRTDIAVAGRAEIKLAGDWKQFDDFTSWSKDQLGILLGAGIDYEVGEGGSGTNTPDVLKYTADASVEVAGFNLFGAFYGQQFSDNDSTAGLPTDLDDANQIGLVAQAGVFLIPDKFELFGRYEWIDFDGAYYRNNGGGTQGGTRNLTDDDELSIVTFGGNWYARKHNLKLTLDVAWALDPVPVANTGAGFLASSDDDQVVLRSQVQFAF
jgi:hypothetical protein